jgi:hypothetical protein
MVDRPLVEIGQLLRAHFHVLFGQRDPGSVLTADRPATGMMHTRQGRAATARDVDHVAIGVSGEPG